MTALERYLAKIDPPNEKGCKLWNASTDRGYGQFWNGTRKVWAHIWTYEQFVGSIPEGFSVCHKCDNPSCQTIEHLWLGTQKDNNLDRHSKGRSRGGSNAHENHPNAKLNEDQVKEIRMRYKKGKITQEILGREFGVGQTTISEIVNNHLWK